MLSISVAMTQYRQVIELYRNLLRKGKTLKLTDKQYYFRRIRAEFDKNKHLSQTEEVQRCIEVFFM